MTSGRGLKYRPQCADPASKLVGIRTPELWRLRCAETGILPRKIVVLRYVIAIS